MKIKHQISGFLSEGKYKLGYRLDGYYLEMSDEDYAKWFGTKITVLGDLLIIPGLDPLDDDGIIRQGASTNSMILTNIEIFNTI